MNTLNICSTCFSFFKACEKSDKPKKINILNALTFKIFNISASFKYVLLWKGILRSFSGTSHATTQLFYRMPTVVQWRSGIIPQGFTSEVRDFNVEKIKLHTIDHQGKRYKELWMSSSFLDYSVGVLSWAVWWVNLVSKFVFQGSNIFPFSHSSPVSEGEHGSKLSWEGNSL